jgi:hypothetical protein
MGLQHPRATFREIEAALDENLARVRARMLKDATSMSRAAELEAEAAGAAYVKLQTAEVERLERTAPEPPEGQAVQLQSVDGALVPLLPIRLGVYPSPLIQLIQTMVDRLS